MSNPCRQIDQWPIARKANSEKPASSAPQHPAQKQLVDYYIGELERPFGPGVAWEVLASVFLNVAIRALSKVGAITELRRIADWLERTDARKPRN